MGTYKDKRLIDIANFYFDQLPGFFPPHTYDY